MANLPALKSANATRWSKAKIKPERLKVFTKTAQALIAAKARYREVSARTGVPWPFIAVVHDRESSQNFNRSLAQGDPWNQVSTHVPKGRGPFSSWEDAAVDALKNCSPFAARNSDWSPAGTLTMLEQYNGLGYANRGLPSPYVWAGTDQYTKGKYVADGLYDPNVTDIQLGCAGLLMEMARLDPTITFMKPPVAPSAPAAPAGTPLPKVSWLNSLLDAVLKAFRKAK